MWLCSLNCKVSVNANYARIQSHQYSNLKFNFTSWDVNQRGINNNCERNPSPRHCIRLALYQRGALFFYKERDVGGIPHQLINFREISFALKGILHQKNFYRLNLIFWIVMGCGIAHFGRSRLFSHKCQIFICHNSTRMVA